MYMDSVLFLVSSFPVILSLDAIAYSSVWFSKVGLLLLMKAISEELCPVDGWPQSASLFPMRLVTYTFDYIEVLATLT